MCNRGGDRGASKGGRRRGDSKDGRGEEGEAETHGKKVMAVAECCS